MCPAPSEAAGACPDWLRIACRHSCPAGEARHGRLDLASSGLGPGAPTIGAMGIGDDLDDLTDRDLLAQLVVEIRALRRLVGAAVILLIVLAVFTPIFR